MSNINRRVPVVVGVIGLDAVHIWDKNCTKRQVQLRFGGVCKHVACTLGVLGKRPRFISVRYSGELGSAVANLLDENGVEWLPLPYETPLCFFQAEVDSDGKVKDEIFVENGAIEQLTPSALRTNEHTLNDAGILLSCTDLAIDSLRELHAIARHQAIPFWLVSTSVEEVWKIGELTQPPEVIGMNLAEFQAFSGKDFRTLSEIALAARQVVTDNGVCLVTLGSRGAILCLGRTNEFLYQTVPCVFSKSTVGAGDVLLASLLAAHMSGQEWGKALQFASAAAVTYISADHWSKSPYQSLAGTLIQMPPSQRMPL